MYVYLCLYYIIWWVRYFGIVWFVHITTQNKWTKCIQKKRSMLIIWFMRLKRTTSTTDYKNKINIFLVVTHLILDICCGLLKTYLFWKCLLWKNCKNIRIQNKMQLVMQYLFQKSWGHQSIISWVKVSLFTVVYIL